jgi:predicted permease
MSFPSETPRWRRYVRFWRRDVEADVDDELAFHFQSRVSELTDRGATVEAARRQAHEEFGDVDEFRRHLHDIDRRIAKRADRLEWLEGWRQDLRCSVRSLRRAPGVTLTVVLTLALGLGANAAMFTLLNAVFLRPPAGVRQPANVRRLWTELAFRSGRQFWSGYDYPQYQAVRDALAGIATTTAYFPPAEVKVGRGSASSHAMRTLAPSDFFALLGIRPALGRFFTPDEDRLGAGQRVVVASYAYWRRALDADPTVIGETIRLGGEPFTLIGVAEPEFTGADLSASDLWVPLATTPNFRGTPWWTDSGVNGLQILIRLGRGATDAAIDSRAQLALRRPELRRGDSLTVTRVGSIIAARGPGKKVQEVQIATRLGGVALVVLMIACANVVSLLLARAVRRRREIAMRLALGISRGRLARLILTESVLLAALAGVGAILAAVWGGLALRALLLPDVHWARSPVDWRVLGGAIAATILAGLAAGIIPAVQSGSTELTDVLKSGAREGHVARSRLRALLVVAQVALSVMLLVGAALFVRSLANVRALGLGFDADRLIYARVTYDTPDARRDSLIPARLADAAAKLRAVPGVQSAALTAMRPMYGFSMLPFFPDADTLAHAKPDGMFWVVSPGYFATTGTRIVAGTDFPNASAAGTPPSVIVNTAMANALWPGESPLGRCVRFDNPDGRCNTVIGVVETARWGRVIEEATPQFYLPLANMPFPGWAARAIALRAEPSSAPSIVRAARQVLTSEFPGADPVIEPMATVVEPNYRPWRLGATLFTMFGVLAGVVAALGVYSTVSYSVSQRTHEFGVRIALGAQFGDVMRHVLAEGLRTVVIGVAGGVILSLLAGRLVATLLYGITPRDPVALAVVAAILLGAATIAALVPGWRAARVDPMRALRLE